MKYKDIFRKRCIIFNNTPRIGVFTTVEDLSYLAVVPMSMISDNLSQSEMLLFHALTKDWDRFSRQMKTSVISGPTRSLSKKKLVFKGF